MQAEKRGFLQRVVLVDGIGALFLLTLAAVWLASDALLLIFACILFAVLLFELSSRLQKRLHSARRLAPGVLVAALFVLLGVGGWLMAPQISDQAGKLAAEVPAAIERLREALKQYPLLGSGPAGGAAGGPSSCNCCSAPCSAWPAWRSPRR